jgi:Cytochrome c7 and related cytochrome c/Class III cytochrome C family
VSGTSRRSRPGILLLAACGDRLPPAPAQPIAFSHRVHVALNNIGCTSCHAYAERAPVAGIPSMARCQGCHKFVKEDKKDPAITAEIKVLLKILEDEKPIEWVRVHRVPDHVFFTHQRHVRAGVQCAECHGEVEKMETARQVSPLTMGWCLECHRRRQAERPAERARLTECLTCHK